jgi:molybdenum cofactor synthesis domain-containing protein
MLVQMEIICIGNELLIGKTLNTNASWIAKRSTSLGVAVQRVTIVGDDVNEIAKTVQETLERKPRFIIATGGLGPTFDDKTLEGIARALNRKLEVNERALQMLKTKYETLAKERSVEVELTPPRIKMATLPEGTEPLHNAVGTAPGVMTQVAKTFLIMLPGVPPEMESIFEESVIPLIKKEAGDAAFFERSIYSDHLGEPAIAPLIDQVMRENPLVYIKSHVYVKSRGEWDRKRSRIELHFSTRNKNPEAALKHLMKAEDQLSELIKKKGGEIRHLKMPH